MTKMFSSLPSPPGQLAQLKIVWKNLHLFYLERIEVLAMNSISDLLEKGRIAEYARQVTEARRRADVKPVLIDPDLPYRGSPNKLGQLPPPPPHSPAWPACSVFYHLNHLKQKDSIQKYSMTQINFVMGCKVATYQYGCKIDRLHPQN